MSIQENQFQACVEEPKVFFARIEDRETGNPLDPTSVTEICYNVYSLGLLDGQRKESIPGHQKVSVPLETLTVARVFEELSIDGDDRDLPRLPLRLQFPIRPRLPDLPPLPPCRKIRGLFSDELKSREPNPLDLSLHGRITSARPPFSPPFPTHS